MAAPSATCLGILLTACLVTGQTARPAFEVATVKPAQSIESRTSGGPGTSSPDRITLIGQPLKSLLRFAFGSGSGATGWLKADQVSGPAWMTTERFDIIANLPSGSNWAQVHLMLQDLLAERFQMQSHRETKQIDGYALLLAPGGLKPGFHAAATDPFLSDDGEQPPPNFAKMDRDGFVDLPAGRSVMVNDSTGGGRIVLAAGRARSMEMVMGWMEAQTGTPIVDLTGLQGNFDFKLKFDPLSMPNSVAARFYEMGGLTGRKPAPDPSAPLDAPDFLAALQQQLGLKLEKRKLPFEVLVFDRANRTPLEN